MCLFCNAVSTSLNSFTVIISAHLFFKSSIILFHASSFIAAVASVIKYVVKFSANASCTVCHEQYSVATHVTNTVSMWRLRSAPPNHVHTNPPYGCLSTSFHFTKCISNILLVNGSINSLLTVRDFPCSGHSVSD